MIHESLYQSDSFSRIDLDPYVRRLVSEMSQIHRGPGSKVLFTIEVGRIYIGIDQSVPCGLVLHELISNAFKHAFDDDQAGAIEIRASLNGDNLLEIVVADNGKGLPENFDLRNQNSLGMRLIFRLVEAQLGGSVTVERDHGAKFIVRFPLSGSSG